MREFITIYCDNSITSYHRLVADTHVYILLVFTHVFPLILQLNGSFNGLKPRRYYITL